MHRTFDGEATPYINVTEPHLALSDGQLSEVTWFTGSADNNARRAIRLKLSH